MKIVILAGGKGSRLWPLSRQKYPKPLLRLAGTRSFLQTAVLRFSGVCSPSSLLVTAGASFGEEVKKQCNEVDPSGEIRILEESSPRGTGPAIASAFRFLEECDGFDPSEPVLVVPCDGSVSPLDNFLEEIAAAEPAAKEGFIVLFGVLPTKRESSYGYIRKGVRKERFFTVEGFIEKPSPDLLDTLFCEGSLLWNTGHVMLTAETFWAEIALHAPRLLPLREGSAPEPDRDPAETAPISIDRMLLEKTGRLLVSDMDVSWSDLGTWDRLYEAFPKNDRGNVEIGGITEVGCKNCFLLSENPEVVAIGLEDVVVIQTEAGILVAKREEAYKIGVLDKGLETESPTEGLLDSPCRL